MGIFIYEATSHSITMEEWKNVYDETLLLMEKLPFAERGTISRGGEKGICLVRSEEREYVNGDKKSRKWRTCGDYNTGKTAEEYYLWSDAVKEDKIVPEAGDAILALIPKEVRERFPEDDLRFKQGWSIWDAKTQGEPYHNLVLAVACLLEDRLGYKAFVFGDITRGQCKKAVSIANQVLEKPIDVPARCDLNRFFERISKLPLNSGEKLDLFTEYYLGEHNAEFYEFVNKNFPRDVVWEGWEKEFSSYLPGTRGFSSTLKKYLTAGFGLKDLCRITKFEDKEGKPLYEAFIKAVMDTKMHIEDKDTKDLLDIDQEREAPYGVWALFAEFSLGSAHNYKVDCYVPAEEIRETLRECIRDKFDVDAYMDQYLKEEKDSLEKLKGQELNEDNLEEKVKSDPAGTLAEVIDKRAESEKELRKEYDCVDPEDFLYYEKGDRIPSKREEWIKGNFKIYHEVLEEDSYKELLEDDPDRRCGFLLQQNRQFLLRDCDWERIFSDIESRKEAFSRYYPMVRLDFGTDSLIHLIKAYLLNDDFYEWVESLPDGEQPTAG